MSQKNEQIKYLVSRKFPVNYIPREKKLIFQAQVKEGMWPEINKNISAYMNELSQKTPEEIKALYVSAVRQASVEERKYQEERMRSEEQDRFFNKPSANADFKHWGKMPCWRVDEAIALSFGKSPERVSWEKISLYKDRSPFVREYIKRQDLVSRALKTKELKHDPGILGSGKKIKPRDFIDWAEGNDIEFPLVLKEMVLGRKDKNTDLQALYGEKCLEVEQLKERLEHSQGKRKELVTKARASTNSNKIPKMALAVIAEERYKYGKDSSAIGNMLSYLAKQGLNIDDQTLRNRIDEGLILLKSRKMPV